MNAVYRKEKQGVSMTFTDGQLSGKLYAEDYPHLYRAGRFLTLRHLDKTGFSKILADTHGDLKEVA